MHQTPTGDDQIAGLGLRSNLLTTPAGLDWALQSPATVVGAQDSAVLGTLQEVYSLINLNRQSATSQQPTTLRVRGPYGDMCRWRPPVIFPGSQNEGSAQQQLKRHVVVISPPHVVSMSCRAAWAYRSLACPFAFFRVLGADRAASDWFLQPLERQTAWERLAQDSTASFCAEALKRWL